MKRSELVEYISEILKEVPIMINHYGETDGCKIQASHLINKLDNMNLFDSNTTWESENEN